MVRRSVVALYLLLGLPLTIVPVDRANGQAKEADAKEAKGVIIPELDRCTLEVDGRNLKAVHTSSSMLPEHAAKDLRITIDGSTVRNRSRPGVAGGGTLAFAQKAK
jgi:hypothetical protein